MKEKFDLNFAISEAEKHFTELMKNTEKNFIIVSIDMQPKFLMNVKSKLGTKVPIMIEYHKRLRDLAHLNNIDFVEINFIKQNETPNESNFNVLKHTKNIPFNKSEAWINNDDFYTYLDEKNVNHILIIGIFQNNCMKQSIFRIHSKDKYPMSTSLIGTGREAVYDQGNLSDYFKTCREYSVRILDYDKDFKNEKRFIWKFLNKLKSKSKQEMRDAMKEGKSMYIDSYDTFRTGNKEYYKK